MGRCAICTKSAVSGSQISHSQIHTKRKFKANLQKVGGTLVCTRCLKTIKKETK
ncbi:MAG: L28 family ribosomal protein [Candidatus Berkelbacteria bacterium]|jgi:large subunit ribosomal protein L28